MTNHVFLLLLLRLVLNLPKDKRNTHRRGSNYECTRSTGDENVVTQLAGVSGDVNNGFDVFVCNLAIRAGLQPRRPLSESLPRTDDKSTGDSNTVNSDSVTNSGANTISIVKGSKRSHFVMFY